MQGLEAVVATNLVARLVGGILSEVRRLAPAAALLALAVVLLLAPAPAQAQPKPGDCQPRLTERLDATSVALGDSVGVEIALDPGCPGGSIPRHYVLALAPWADPAAATAAREMARAFVRSLGPATKIGAVLGDRSPPRVVPIGSTAAQMDAALQTFGATAGGATVADLIRAAHNAYADTHHPITGISTLPVGKRHIVVVSHAAAPLGRESQIRFDAEIGREIAIALDLVCVGGGCPALEGIGNRDSADIAGAGQALADLDARPAPTELEWARVRGTLGQPVDYLFGSAAPPASRLGRDAPGAFIEWRSALPIAAATYAYRVRPLASGSVGVARSVVMEGVTSAGFPARAVLETQLRIPVDPRPGQPRPSRCGLRAEAVAGPDPMLLGSTAGVTLTLVADCPPGTREVDVVLAIDRSSSMLEGRRLADVQTAARAFISRIDFSRARVAVLGFDTRVEALVGLSNDRAAVLAAIDGIAAGGDTAMGQGIDRAREILAARRPGALPVIVLLSDGVVKDDPQPAADWAQLEGIRIVGVCVNAPEACAPKFKPLAAPASYYLATTDPELLARFYADLGAYLGRTDIDQLSVTHSPFPIFTYTGGGPVHDRPQVAGDGRLTWQRADPLFGRTQLVYPLDAIGPGRWPIAESIHALWRDSEGEVGTASLTIPELTVLPPDDAGPCRPERLERRVDRDRLPVGEALSTTVQIDLACASAPLPIEIALVVDHSYSMRGQRLTDTRAAVDALLAETSGLDARFGLVAFSDVILAQMPLTADRAAIRDQMAQLDVSGLTNIGLAIDTAVALLADARPGARRFIVLLTDGENSPNARPIPPAALNAREAGIEIIAVCAGGACDAELKTAVSQPAFYFDVPDSAGLVALYRQIGAALSGLLPASLEVTDQAGPALLPVPGSAVPVPMSGPDPQVWSFGFPPDAGVSISQRLTAARPGRYPAMVWTRVDYLTADGRRGQLYVPPNPVTIDGPAPAVPPTALPLPTATPTPTDTPVSTPSPSPTITPSPTPTLRPEDRGLYLPWTGREVRMDELPPPQTAPPPTETPTATGTPTSTPTSTASPTRTRAPTRTNTPTPTVTRTPTATRTPAPNVQLVYLTCEGNDEAAEVVNRGNASAQISGWRLRTLPARRTFSFPSYRLDPGARVSVHSGPDAPETGNGRIRWTLNRMWQGQDGGELINRQGVVVGGVNCN